MRKVYSIYNGSVWNAERTEQYVYGGWTLDTPRLGSRDGWHGHRGPLPAAASQGWNVVLVLDDANVTQRKYTWGLDLSGTLHGAGGIGGLLAAVETHGTPTTADDEAYWFLYDANGNVWQVLNGTPAYPTIAAKYEYDPYGNVISQPSPYDYDNPIRFSTKWFDTELAGPGTTGAVGTSGLGYWGYRYYSPRLGRWVSRDPIGERGGLNLQQYVRSDPTNHGDPLGLASDDDDCPSGLPDEWCKKVRQYADELWSTGCKPGTYLHAVLILPELGATEIKFGYGGGDYVKGVTVKLPPGEEIWPSVDEKWLNTRGWVGPAGQTRYVNYVVGLAEASTQMQAWSLHHECKCVRRKQGTGWGGIRIQVPAVYAWVKYLDGSHLDPSKFETGLQKGDQTFLYISPYDQRIEGSPENQHAAAGSINQALRDAERVLTDLIMGRLDVKWQIDRNRGFRYPEESWPPNPYGS